jgi:hypothetical protein
VNTNTGVSLMKNVANTITISRIILALLLLLINAFTLPFYVLYTLCGLSDMIDGFMARKTHTESALGSKLDSIADIVFVAVCLIKIMPVIDIKTWLFIWMAVIFLVKVVNIISGYVCHKKLILLHTLANKLTGLLLFLLPLTLAFTNIDYAAIPICIAATFAAVQEGHYIRTGRIGQ